MNKETLSRELAPILDLPIERRWGGKSYRIVKSIFDVIADALQRGDSVKIDGLGIFRIREKPATRSACYYFYGRSNKVKCVIKDIPAKRYVYFQPSKPIIRKLNRGAYDEA